MRWTLNVKKGGITHTACGWYIPLDETVDGAGQSSLNGKMSTAGVFTVFSYSARLDHSMHTIVYSQIWFESTQSCSTSIIILRSTLGALHVVSCKQSLILYAQGSKGLSCGSWDQIHMKTMCHPRQKRTTLPIYWNTWHVYYTKNNF